VNLEELKNINIEDFNYNLPDERIAKYPLKQRDSSKLLVYKNQQISESTFKNISEELPANSLLIYNNTKVIQARMHFKKETGANIEIFCLEPHSPTDYNLIFQETQSCQWKCIVGNLKKWKQGELINKIEVNSKEIELKANKISHIDKEIIIEFNWNNNVDFASILEGIGEIPIPPYLNRKSEETDKTTYQTIYSEHKGSVAAPTAGLHFTDSVFNSLKQKNISLNNVTLHVGAGTFKPVQSKTIGEHTMHFEHFTVSRKLIEDIKQNFGNVFAVGTTSVRTIESIYYIGLQILDGIDTNYFIINQWDAYEHSTNLSTISVLDAVIEFMDINDLERINAQTQIMIVPGYKFKFINGLITNFHQPKSTLLLLISAITGDNWKNIYNYCLDNEFRFLSYGDSSLLFID